MSATGGWSTLELWQAIILGLVEGLTEYIPVSSTGHLILAQSLLGMNSEESKSAADAYAVIIQGGAILAVVGLYWRSIQQMLLGLLGRDDDGRRLFINIVIAFLPAAVLGPLLNDAIQEYLFRPAPVLIALALGGVWMIGLDITRKRRERMDAESTARESCTESANTTEPTTSDSVDMPKRTLHCLTPKQALGIGLFQCVAMWPGMSRSMMTIAGGTMLGLRPRGAAEFSFLLGLPTLGGACLFSLVKDLAATADDPTRQNVFQEFGTLNIIVGILVATVSAMLAVRWLVSFLTRHGLKTFGIYRLILSIIFLLMMMQGVIDL